MTDRFFIDADFEFKPDVRVHLAGTEANHLARVLRKQPGDEVELFNGRGWSGQASVVSVANRRVELDLRQVHHEALQRGLWLAVAPPKGERFRWMVEKLTELGVERLIPLQCERSVVNPGDSKLDKLRQNVIASCKQCRRNHLMQISDPMGLPKLVEVAASENAVLTFAHPQAAEDDASIFSAVQRVPSDPLIVCVGPEGGFSDDEIGSATQNGASFMSLGSNILRVETAAVAVAAVYLSR